MAGVRPNQDNCRTIQTLNVPSLRVDEQWSLFPVLYGSLGRNGHVVVLEIAGLNRG